MISGRDFFNRWPSDDGVAETTMLGDAVGREIDLSYSDHVAILPFGYEPSNLIRLVPTIHDEQDDPEKNKDPDPG